MARPVKPRATYTEEAITLSRILRVVEKDNLRPPTWKEEVMSLLRDVISKFQDDAVKGRK